ncbi:MAG: aldo/keto reductase [Spirochaetes bacterium]|nr:aldo/keto reductase [Spirochaetota bacterium]
MAYQAAENRYQEMKYNRCGKSGLRLSALSLGLWHNFGSKDSAAASTATVHRAFDLGITHFDLANNYGPPPGSAEERFGKILRGMGRYRDEMIVSTKAGYYMWKGPYGDLGSRKYLLSSLDQSLSRMKIPYVDIFYHHRPDPDTPLEETMGALATAVRQGKALYAGISNYKPEEAGRAIRILRDLGTPCVIHQPSYSMYNRWIEDGLLDVLGNEGVGCIVFSPLAQGMLTDRYFKGIPAGSRATKSQFLTKDKVDEARLDKSRKLNELALARGQTLAQLALAWVLRDSRVTTALIGASSPRQVEENVGALKRADFPAEDLARIEAILKG